MQFHRPTTRNQSGFSAIEVLLVVFVVAAIAVTGLVVYQHHKPSSAKTSAATGTTQTTTQPQSTTTTQPAQTTATTLDIKEWGVHMTLDSTTASLYYNIKPALPNVAYLSLKTLSNISPDWAADKTSLGAIVRLTPAEQQAALSNPSPGEPGTIQIGNYWYGYSKSPAGCYNSTEDAAVQNAQPGYNIATTIPKAFDTLAADPLTN